MEALLTLLLGLACLLFGAVHVRWPYRIARSEERIDAIGSKRSSGEVEHTDWKVTMTRGFGVVMALIGVVYISSALIRRTDAVS